MSKKDVEKMAEKFDNFSDTVSKFNPLESKAPLEEKEPQTKIAQKQAKALDVPHIKPLRSLNRPQGGKDRATVYFNPDWKAQRDYDWEEVCCIVENREVIGEAVEVWTGKWGCDPAHFWKIPVNKMIMIPRHLAVQLSECKYHRLIMQENQVTSSDGMGTYVGAMVATSTINRIDCKEGQRSFGSDSFKRIAQ